MLRASGAKSFAMKNIGERAKDYRESRGWNTSEMARAVGTSRQNIESLEAAGDRKPRYIAALARVMGVSTDDLLSSTHQATSITPSGHFGTPTATQTAPDLVIPQYAAGGSMGNGLVLEEKQPGIIKSWHVDQEWLRLNVKSHTGAKNLCIVTGFGPSMRPLYNPGDPLLLDSGVKEVESEGVFFFRIGDHGYIKQLQRIPVGRETVIRAKSLNPTYDPFNITPDMDFEVFGKVLTVWKSEQV